MSFGEPRQQNQLPPLAATGELAHDLPTPEMPVSGEVSEVNPLVVSTYAFDLVTDLATAYELRGEITALIQRRAGSTALHAGDQVSWSYKPLNERGGIAEPPQSVEARALQDVLDTDVGDVLLQAGAEHTWQLDKTVRALRASGFSNLRDALVLGRKKINSHQRSFQLAREKLREVCPQEEFKLNPDIDQAARLCSDLSFVPATVTMDIFHDGERRWSIQDVLTRSSDELLAAYLNPDTARRWSEQQREECVAELKGKARAYAARFFAAQQRVRESER